MNLSEQNRYRIARSARRYEAHIQAAVARAPVRPIASLSFPATKPASAARTAYDEAFAARRDEVILPVFEATARALEEEGHAPVIALDDEEERPSVALHLGLREVESRYPLLAFVVIEWFGRPEVLAYSIVRPPPMDLHRWADLTTLSLAQVEQLTVDAVENLLACCSS